MLSRGVVSVQPIGTAESLMLTACFLFACENQTSYETWRFPEFSNFVTSPTNPTGVVFGYETGVNIHDIYPRSVTNPDLAGAIGPSEKGQHLPAIFETRDTGCGSPLGSLKSQRFEKVDVSHDPYKCVRCTVGWSFGSERQIVGHRFIVIIYNSNSQAGSRIQQNAL